MDVPAVKYLREPASKSWIQLLQQVGPRMLGHSAELPVSWACVIGIGVLLHSWFLLWNNLEIPWYVLICKLAGAQIRIPVIEELAHKLAGK